MSHHQNPVGPGVALGQSVTLCSHLLRSHSDEEDLDLNKAFDVQCFQQILHPAASSPPEKLRVYDEQDFEDHRHSSLHVHHPLSKSRRTNEGRREGGRGSAPNPVNPIEEDWEEEEREEEPCSHADEEEGQTTIPSSDPPSDSTYNDGRSAGVIMTGVAMDDADEAETLMSVDLDGIKSQ